jgi:hypothetical protein
VAPLTARAAGAAALLLAASAVSADALEVTPAWGGGSRPGRMTELRLRVEARSAGLTRLGIDAGAVRVEGEYATTGEAPRYLHVAVPPADAYRVTVRAPGGQLAERRLELRLAELPLVALAVPGVGDWPDALARAEVGADAFPVHAAGYDAVDAVALDAATLAALAGDQREALVGFVARCGIVTVVGVPAAVGAVLRDAAGCDGGALRFVDDPRDVAGAVTAALEQPPRAAPAPAELANLLAPGDPIVRTLALALALYAAGALVVTARARRARLPLGYAALGLAAVSATSALLPPARAAVVWAEGEADGSRPAFTALARVEGTHRGTTTLDVPAALGTPHACGGPAGTPAVWEWRADGERYVAIHVPETLLGIAASCWQGTLGVRRAAAVDGPPQGPWRVENRGADAWPAGLLLTAGGRHPLPALGAHAAGTVPAAAAADSAAARLGAARTGAAATLLWPIDTRAFGLADATGFLALAAGPSGAGR